MTHKVSIAIKGLQFASDDEDVIEVINIGRFAEKNGTTYIKYDDIMEGSQETTSNLNKITDKGVEITKKGPVTAHMSFIENEKTMTYYDTPFGSIYLGIFSRKVNVERLENEMKIEIDYSLELNYELVSECNVSISVASVNKEIQLS